MSLRLPDNKSRHILENAVDTWRLRGDGDRLPGLASRVGIDLSGERASTVCVDLKDAHGDKVVLRDSREAAKRLLHSGHSRGDVNRARKKSRSARI